MRYSISTSNLRIYQRIGNNMFSVGKNFEHNGNSVHTEESLALGNALNIYMYQLFDVLP